VWVFVEQFHAVLLLEMGQRFGQGHCTHQWKTLFHPSIRHSTERFHKLRYIISLNENIVIYLLTPKPVLDRFRESAQSICKLTNNL